MEEDGWPRKKVLSKLEDFSTMDRHFTEGSIFGSMCTRPHDLALHAHAMFLESNLGNRGLYPGTAEMEKELVEDVGTLLHLSDPAGQVVSGGTESNIIALWASREKTNRKRVLLPASAHFSFIKACQMLKMEPVVVPLDEEYVMDLDSLEGALEEELPACIVTVAGATETGYWDPIDKVGAMIRGKDVPLHVDAAFGGFVLPFIDDPPEFDFAIPEVTSITIDPHKMGMGTIPSGMIIYRQDSFLSGIRSQSPYLTQRTHYSVTGTKGSAGVASAYSAVKSLGRRGYARVVKRCMEMTDYAIVKAENIGISPSLPPKINVLVLDVEEPEELYQKLMGEGLFASVSKNPPGLRLVIMPHVDRSSLDRFFSAVEGVL